jgi:hypothetical protein
VTDTFRSELPTKRVANIKKNWLRFRSVLATASDRKYQRDVNG